MDLLEPVSTMVGSKAWESFYSFFTIEVLSVFVWFCKRKLNISCYAAIFQFYSLLNVFTDSCFIIIWVQSFWSYKSSVKLTYFLRTCFLSSCSASFIKFMFTRCVAALSFRTTLHLKDMHAQVIHNATPLKNGLD